MVSKCTRFLCYKDNFIEVSGEVVNMPRPTFCGADGEVSVTTFIESPFTEGNWQPHAYMVCADHADEALENAERLERAIREKDGKFVIIKNHGENQIQEVEISEW